MKGDIVAYSASLLTDEKTALSPHTWKEITANGYASTHNSKGEYLYGFETCVDKSVRGKRLGLRIYNARKELVKFKNLKGIVFGGRIPNYHKKAKKVKDIFDYIQQVQNKKIKDPTLGFHLRRGFQIISILENYLPGDKESLGFAIHLKWENPGYEDVVTEGRSPHRQNSVRVVSVQYQFRPVESFEEFAQIVEYYVDVSREIIAQTFCSFLNYSQCNYSQ